ncbi:MAG: TIGR03936 family radical SAM-associated protein [Candidatus Obscuribacterales bacterium]|nr:TIGR03936 family radical SAM-associated protein [Candidatus Obscuribacterales bacterium]
MGLRNVNFNFTLPETSLLEAVISRGDRKVGSLIYSAWKSGCVFDAWDERFKADIWHKVASELGMNLEDMACIDREVGSRQPWDVVHIGLADWWLVKEWEKALAVKETAPCTENTCHACGVCTELDTTHLLAAPRPEQLKKNPFVKELAVYKEEDDSHPSLFFMKPEEPKNIATKVKIRFEIKKLGELKFVGHLDLQHLLVRAIRRAQIEISHTEGFNPSPKLALASALPLLQESLAEVAEIELSELIAADEFMQRVNSMLPSEVKIVRARMVALRSPSLATSLNSARYRVAVSGQLTQEEVLRAKTLIDDLLKKPKLEVAKTTKSGVEQMVDIKPGIFALKVVQESPLTLELDLATGSKMHVKPTDVLRLIEVDFIRSQVIWTITRTGMFAPEGISLFDLDDGLADTAVSTESGTKTLAMVDKS